MKKKCKNCKWFRKHQFTIPNDLYWDYKDGHCYRFPQFIAKWENRFCGEWKYYKET